ncbi:MAG: GNAT family N-acetyltransferase, partial [Bacteroidota bacterium]
WISLVLNTLLFVLKYWAGVVTGSVALIADAWHTLSDSLTSLIVLVGVKASSKPPDKNHPFGHGRAEMIGALVIGILLAIVGFSFLIESIDRLYSKDTVVFGKIAIVATVVSLVVKEGLAQFSIRMGKKFNIKSLIADGWHHRSDALSSLVILIGIFFGKYYWWMDGVLGIIVAVMIFYTTFIIMKDTISPLIGEKPDEITEQQIRQISKEVFEKELNIHHLRLHRYGHHSEITFHIELPGTISLDEAHTIASRLEQQIINQTGYYPTIHMEPLGLHITREDVRIIAFNFSDTEHFKIAHEIRRIVFVDEQGVDAKLEFDGMDNTSTHYLIFFRDEPVATARWRETEKGIKLERFAVLKEFRQRGFAKIILNEIMKEVLPMGKTIYLNSQTSATGFYKRNGFRIIGEKFEEADIEHYQMIYKEIQP